MKSAALGTHYIQHTVATLSVCVSVRLCHPSIYDTEWWKNGFTNVKSLTKAFMPFPSSVHANDAWLSSVISFLCGMKSWGSVWPEGRCLLCWCVQRPRHGCPGHCLLSPVLWRKVVSKFFTLALVCLLVMKCGLGLFFKVKLPAKGIRN